MPDAMPDARTCSDHAVWDLVVWDVWDKRGRKSEMSDKMNSLFHKCDIVLWLSWFQQVETPVKDLMTLYAHCTVWLTHAVSCSTFEPSIAVISKDSIWSWPLSAKPSAAEFRSPYHSFKICWWRYDLTDDMHDASPWPYCLIYIFWSFEKIWRFDAKWGSWPGCPQYSR